MAQYLVRWEIDIEADAPEEAAQKARDAQMKLDTTDTVFDVFECEPGGDSRQSAVLVAHVDLSYPEETEHFTTADIMSGRSIEVLDDARRNG